MNLPNKITLSRIFMVPVFMLFVIQLPHWATQTWPILEGYNDFITNYGYYIGAIFYIIASSTDGVDGYIARKRKQVTTLGKFMDPIADKLLTTAALIALVERYGANPDSLTMGVSGWCAMIIIARELLVTGLRLAAAGQGIIIAAGKLGKIKMIIQTIAISVALLNNYPMSEFINFPFDAILMTAAVIITVWSGIDYFVKNAKVLNSEK
ncbi:MAG TPA: CDP-diacylglycerol--glycerol-3-phosphate 3-phosphatidyltransferase [Clostridia bacterium]|nr:CDP-diacylglycerol--glycerol-3-phosphate 3-phosphatidyltransferase [Clostridia bacterium]